MAFSVDELNQHAIDEAAHALGYAACPVADSQCADIAERIATELQSLQRQHGMGYMLELSQGYAARTGMRKLLWDAYGVTGPQTDAAIQVAARTLWNEA